MKATSAKKTPKGAKKANGPRDGSKTAKVLDLLKRPNGATPKGTDESDRLAAAFGPGVYFGTIGKKMKLTVVSIKGEGGERNNAIKA